MTFIQHLFSCFFVLFDADGILEITATLSPALSEKEEYACQSRQRKSKNPKRLMLMYFLVVEEQVVEVDVAGLA